MESANSNGSKHHISDLFYWNIGEIIRENKPDIVGELKHLENFIWVAERNMKLDNFGVKWKREYYYRIYPVTKIAIKIPRDRIKIFSKFKGEKPMMDENENTIGYSVVKKGDNFFIIELHGRKIKKNTSIYYGLSSVKWEYVNRQNIKITDNSVFKDELGNKYKVIYQNPKRKNVVYIEEQIAEGTKLFLQGQEIEYNVENSELTNRSRLYLFSQEKKMKTPYEVKFAKISEREIVIDELLRAKYLISERGDLYRIKLERKEKEGEIWISIEDDSDEYTGLDKSDVFFDLLRSGEFEVLEEPNPRTDKRIRVKKMIIDERKLLLEREPKSEVIYPPSNTYQLAMQEKAIKTLLYNPSPDHGHLLKLFVDRDKTGWPEPDISQFDDIKWEFLTDESIEGTDEQRNFVKKALATEDFALMQGPPGSGKTTTITELIYQLLKMKKRVLLAASTHVAVDNVLEKLHDHFKGKVMDYGIVPLRIGREEVVSEVILEYQIDEREEDVRSKMNDFEWFRELSEEDKERAVKEFVVKTSNLVCGTTIGILQYPPFREEHIRGKFVYPEFDVLVIDEASKTTLPEFFVPAVHSKKHIIVGDVKQLSPYMDVLSVRVLVDNEVSDLYLKKALLVFLQLIYYRNGSKMKGRGYPPPKFIYVDESRFIKVLAQIIFPKLDELINAQKNERRKNNLINLKNNGIGFVVKRPYNSHNREKREEYYLTENDFYSFGRDAAIYLYQFLTSKEILFIEKYMFEKFRDIFPSTHILLMGGKNKDPHNFRHLHWFRDMQEARHDVPYMMRIDKAVYSEYDEIQDELERMFGGDWAYQISWRLKRVQELELVKDDSGSKGSYKSALLALMPPRNLQESRNAYHSILNIARLLMPSVLKSLQEGVYHEWTSKKIKNVISHGFDEDTKKQRFELLSYQHRMNPNISKIPREMFYDGEALKDSRIARNKRGWGYKEYPEKAMWIDAPYDRDKRSTHVRRIRIGKEEIRNVNQSEAEIIVKELDKFVSWASNHKKKYTVIILSFYEGQRKYIRNLLREKYPENSRKQTRFKIKGQDVRVYTVDRVQGKEGDIVFLSMTQNRRVGFMDSPNRLNVAITRAKYQLVIVGDRNYFLTQKRSAHLRELADKIKPISTNTRGDKN